MPGVGFIPPQGPSHTWSSVLQPLKVTRFRAGLEQEGELGVAVGDVLLAGDELVDDEAQRAQRAVDGRRLLQLLPFCLSSPLPLAACTVRVLCQSECSLKAQAALAVELSKTLMAEISFSCYPSISAASCRSLPAE